MSDTEEVNTIYEFMRELFPDEEIRLYVYKLMASCVAKFDPEQPEQLGQPDQKPPPMHVSN